MIASVTREGIDVNQRCRCPSLIKGENFQERQILEAADSIVVSSHSQQEFVKGLCFIIDGENNGVQARKNRYENISHAFLG